MRNVFLSFTAIAALSMGTIYCSSETPTAQPVQVVRATAKAPVPARSHPIAVFTATADKAHRTLTFKKVASETSGTLTPSLVRGEVLPESLDPINDPQNVDGNPTSDEVDLVTHSCTDGYPTTPTFSCEVELISGYTRTLMNPYAIITAVTLDGGAISTYDSTSDSLDLSTENGGQITPTTDPGGFWSYTTADANASAVWPYVGPAGGGNNTGTTTWTFANPGDQNIVYTIVVEATEFWADYSPFGNSNGDNTYGNEGYFDTCASGTTVNAASLGGATNFPISLPFDFTLYNVNTTNIVVCPYFGEFTTSASNCASGFTGTPKDLTSANFGRYPVFFPFWEKLTFGSSSNDKSPADISDGAVQAGRICYATIGSAPNRMEVIEWRNMDFASGADTGSSMTFEAFLYEGTGEVDLYYDNMTNGSGGAPGRANCSECFIGTQGEDEGSSTPKGEGAFQLGEVGVAGQDESSATFTPLP